MHHRHKASPNANFENNLFIEFYSFCRIAFSSQDTLQFITKFLPMYNDSHLKKLKHCLRVLVWCTYSQTK